MHILSDNLFPPPFPPSRCRPPNIGAAAGPIEPAPAPLGDPQQQEGHAQHLPGRRLQLPRAAHRMEVLPLPFLCVSKGRTRCTERQNELLGRFCKLFLCFPQSWLGSSAQGSRAGGTLRRQFPNLTVQFILSLSTLSYPCRPWVDLSTNQSYSNVLPLNLLGI